MMPCRLPSVRAFALMMLFTVPAWGQVSSPDVADGLGELEQRSQETRSDRTQIEQSRREAANAWGLDRQEYRRFESIMAGPRGIWSPNLDPLTALGLEARTEAERRRYAEKLVETERRRVEAELAFQRAYDAAWQRRYPDDRPIDPFSTKSGTDATRSIFGSSVDASARRLNVVVAMKGCDRCDATVRRLLSAGAVMDIWIVDANGDDNRIRRWAATLGIAPERVRAGDITLNYGDTLDVDRAELPRVAPRG